MGKKIVLILIAIFMLAFSLRLIYAFTVHPLVVDKFRWDLKDGFDSIAKNFISGYGYTFERGQEATVKRPPGYPFFLMLCYWLFGVRDWPVWVIQSFLDSLTCIMIFLLTKKIIDIKSGIIASFIYAVYPIPIFFVSRYFTESLYTLSMVVFIYFFIDLFINPRVKFAVISGIILGWMILTKAVMIVFPVIAFFALFFFYRYKTKPFFRNFFIFLISSIFVVVPWTVRNYIVSKHFIPVATLGGQVFFQGNIELYDKNHNLMSYTNASVGLNLEAMRMEKEFNFTEYEIDKYLYKITFDYIAKNPVNFIKGVLKKVIKFWYFTTVDWRPSWYPMQWMRFSSLVSIIIQLPLILLGFLGIFIAAKKGIIVLPFLVMIFYNNIIYAFLFAATRYSLPIMPFLIIFAAFFISQSKRINMIFHNKRY